MPFQKRSGPASPRPERPQFWASATLEFEEAAPETIRLVVQAATAETAYKLAFRALKKAHPNRKWTSCVIVLDRKAPQKAQAA